jgi:hypothetical protein
MEKIYLIDAMKTDYPQLVQLQPEGFLYMIRRTTLTNVGFIDASFDMLYLSEYKNRK